MERTKASEVSAEPKILWRKTGGGSFWLNGHIIKPGQEFKATLSEVPEEFRSVIVAVNGIPDPNKVPIPGKETTFKIVPDEEEEGMFRVVNEAGKPLNKKPLTEEKATAFLQNLMS